jgi:hypothetical protein
VSNPILREETRGNDSDHADDRVDRVPLARATRQATKPTASAAIAVNMIGCGGWPA